MMPRYVLQSPRRNFDKYRISEKYSPTLKASDYKDPILAIETDDDETLCQIPLNPMPDGTCRTIKANYYKASKSNFTRSGGYGATAVAFVCDESHADMEIQAERHGVRPDRDSTVPLRR